jgi:uncharacterized protein YndB with AHSA1/START domain
MLEAEVLYVTYINAEPQRVWDALTVPEFTRQYFMGDSMESDWQAGSAWKATRRNGKAGDFGEVLEADPPRLLRITWRSAEVPQYCEVIYRVEDLGGIVRLTVSEAYPDEATAEFLRSGAGAWPVILSGLKSLLETGKGLPAFDMAAVFS